MLDGMLARFAEQGSMVWERARALTAQVIVCLADMELQEQQKKHAQVLVLQDAMAKKANKFRSNVRPIARLVDIVKLAQDLAHFADLALSSLCLVGKVVIYVLQENLKGLRDTIMGCFACHVQLANMLEQAQLHVQHASRATTQ